jgi:hypothetical protein
VDLDLLVPKLALPFNKSSNRYGSSSPTVPVG